MGALGQYILSVASAAIVCALLRSFLGTKGAPSAIGKLLSGLFLLFTLLSPLSSLKLEDFGGLTGDWETEAEYFVIQGEEKTKNELASIIKERTRTYILDKAAVYDAGIAVTVTLSEDVIPVPVGVRISGSISPYAKAQLQAIIENDLGIPKEEQVWT